MDPQIEPTTQAYLSEREKAMDSIRVWEQKLSAFQRNYGFSEKSFRHPFVGWKKVSILLVYFLVPTLMNAQNFCAIFLFFAFFASLMSAGNIRT